jgi:hypothetical protein
MSKFICQKEMVCAGCGDEIPKGAWAYEDMWEDIYCEDMWEDIYCEDCEEEDLEEIDSDNTIGFYRH